MPHHCSCHSATTPGFYHTPSQKNNLNSLSLSLSDSSTPNLFFLPFLVLSSNSNEAERCLQMCCLIFILNGSGPSVYLCLWFSLHSFLSFLAYSDKILILVYVAKCRQWSTLHCLAWSSSCMTSHFYSFQPVIKKSLFHS